MRITYAQFRELCQKCGLAATHQRQAIYSAVMERPGHYSPEEIYEAVRRDVPSVSLATVYKNLKVFIQSGLLREVSPHHGSLRVDPNLTPHHHLVCTECKAIFDIEADAVAPVQLRKRLPQGFRLQQFSVDLLGICGDCSQKKKSTRSTHLKGDTEKQC